MVYIRWSKLYPTPAMARRCIFMKERMNISPSWKALHASHTATRYLTFTLEMSRPSVRGFLMPGVIDRVHRCGSCSWFSRVA